MHAYEAPIPWFDNALSLASRIAGQPWLLLSTYLQSRLQDTQYSAIMARCYYFTVNRSEMIWAAECIFTALHETSMRDIAEHARTRPIIRKSMRCISR
ncbi:hypothetical protein CA260_11320 [Dyella jiangningensis]|uniref:Uncharacterized protein n=1 Tax=Dyella jiangningensis TaxID=1379159 RepID=A0A328P4M7_9GAMM|nr:hypothetical protein CA260_11320 [Dyella jiangningensis]